MSRTAGRRRFDEGETDRQPSHIGSFKFFFVGQRWEWSDEVARMHGYEPGTVEPTTDLLLSHKHPDDRRLVQDLLDHTLHTGESFSSRHRFLDTGGNEHDVLVVGTAIVYQVLSSDVANHLAEYATLKAIGYSNTFVSGVVLRQAVTLAILGFVPGLIFSEMLYRFTTYMASVPILMTLPRIASVLVLTVAMCTVSIRASCTPFG